MTPFPATEEIMNPFALPAESPHHDRIEDDPVFDPVLHLALERPREFFTLADLGYDEASVTTPTSVAATSCFRVLSDEGVEALHHVCKQLERFTTSNSRCPRTESSRRRCRGRASRC